MRDFNAFDDEETKTIETVRPTQSIMEEEIVVNVEHQHKPKKRKNRLEGKRKNSKGDLQKIDEEFKQIQVITNALKTNSN